jgi:hypothetical protein
VVGLAAAIQLVPYGRGGGPAPGVEAPWPSAEARAIAVGSCYDCHSGRPHRPWYSQIAPASWLVQRDIDAGREELDLTAWGRDDQELDADVVEDGEMPPRRYLLLHPGARLDAEERRILAQAIEALDDDDPGRDDDRGRDRGRGRD